MPSITEMAKFSTLIYQILLFYQVTVWWNNPPFLLWPCGETVPGRSCSISTGEKVVIWKAYICTAHAGILSLYPGKIWGQESLGCDQAAVCIVFHCSRSKLEMDDLVPNYQPGVYSANGKYGFFKSFILMDKYTNMTRLCWFHGELEPQTPVPLLSVLKPSLWVQRPVKLT